MSEWRNTFISRLAALVPKPRVHLTRYHGVFAPHSALRATVTPAGRGKSNGMIERSPAERLKRVFGIEIDTCERCGGKLKIIASVEDPAVVGKSLAHLEQSAAPAAGFAPAHPVRGPPEQGALDLN